MNCTLREFIPIIIKNERAIAKAAKILVFILLIYFYLFDNPKFFH